MINEFMNTADAEELKTLRQLWYNTVYSSLETLDQRVDNISDTLSEIKKELKNEMDVLKESLNSDIKSFSKKEMKLAFSLRTVDDRLGTLENSSIKEDLSSAVKDIESSMEKAREKLGIRREKCSEEITTIRERLATVETKMLIFAGLVGAGSSIITTVIAYFLREYILR